MIPIPPYIFYLPEAGKLMNLVDWKKSSFSRRYFHLFCFFLRAKKPDPQKLAALGAT